ncbi:MAG: DUF971 domain-containing protein [Phycisphaerae bacterium]
MNAEQPVALDLDRTRELRIRWADGVETVHPLAHLRRECPCAACREQRAAEAANPLRVMQPPARQVDMVTVRTAELVGNYALRIVWNDGHATGLYDFGLLRSLGAGGAGEA